MDLQNTHTYCSNALNPTVYESDAALARRGRGRRLGLSARINIVLVDPHYLLRPPLSSVAAITVSVSIH